VTRPDLSYAVNKVCQFMATPLDSHWVAVKRILRYLKGFVSHGLHIQAAPSSKPFQIKALCDSDWASDLEDRHSTSGAAIYFGPNLVSWWSKKQTVVARSSTEAEYRSLASAAAEVTWIQTLLAELVVSSVVPALYCDNQSAVAVTHNPVLHSRTKHMEIDVFFVSEKVLTQQLQVFHIPATDQWADALTKPLSPSRFLFLRSKLNVVDSFCTSQPH